MTLWTNYELHKLAGLGTNLWDKKYIKIKFKQLVEKAHSLK